MASAPTLDEQLCFSLYSASMAINRAYKPLLDRLKLTYPQYLVLSTLWEKDNRSIGAIAGRLGLEPSTVTPLVKRLEASGMVSRRRSATDERQVCVSLTEAGESMHERSRCLGERLVAASHMGLDEISALNDRVRSFRDAVASQGRAGAEARASGSDGLALEQLRRVG